jgi:hypothetical protein
VGISLYQLFLQIIAENSFLAAGEALSSHSFISNVAHVSIGTFNAHLAVNQSQHPIDGDPNLIQYTHLLTIIKILKK